MTIDEFIAEGILSGKSDAMITYGLMTKYRLASSTAYKMLYNYRKKESDLIKMLTGDNS